MGRRVKDFIEISEYTSLDQLINTLTAIRDNLPEDAEPELRMKGDDVFGRRMSISYFRELTEEEAACEARYSTATQEASFFSAYIMGLAFAFGWTPCIGPVLATVLTLAASESSLWSGVKLLFVYSLGLGVPFVLAAIAIRPFLGFMKRFKKHFATLEKVMGLLLIATGLLFIFGAQNWFSQWVIENFPGLAKIESLVTPADLGNQILQKGTP